MSVADGMIDGCVFSVVGQHREDPCRLLLLGDDGRYYQLDPLAGEPLPVDPTDVWVIDRHFPTDQRPAKQQAPRISRSPEPAECSPFDPVS